MFVIKRDLVKRNALRLLVEGDVVECIGRNGLRVDAVDVVADVQRVTFGDRDVAAQLQALVDLLRDVDRIG